MRKKTKGLLAASAGAALLLGTGATFALWYDTAEFANTDAIQTGTLELEGDFDLAWVWENVSNADNAAGIARGDDFTPGEQLLVPGDAIIGTFDVDTIVTAEGDTLVWALEAALEDVTVEVPVLDDDGAPVLDDDEQPVTETAPHPLAEFFTITVSADDDTNVVSVFVGFDQAPAPVLPDGWARNASVDALLAGITATVRQVVDLGAWVG